MVFYLLCDYMYQGLYTSKQSNQFKTVLLLVLFPMLLALVVWGVFVFLSDSPTLIAKAQDALFAMTQLMTVMVPIIVIWCLIMFFFQKNLMFHFTGAKEISRKQEPELYNLVENLCISRGLPVPRIGIIEDSGLNAFALGWRMSDSRVVFTRGLLRTLDKKEIEAVAWHELTHILNKDSLLMMVMVLYIGIIGVIGEILMRTRSNDSNNRNPLIFVGIGLIILGYIAYPLIRLAVSRRREFLADAGAVELTHDNQAMISALRKISQKPTINLQNSETASLFIANPLSPESWFWSLFQTHPPIEERISALQNY